MKFSYSFGISPPAPPGPQEQLHTYAYNEFVLSLTEDWKQLPTPEERTFNWYSEEIRAGITVSAVFFEVPQAKWSAFAEVNLDSRKQAFEKVAQGPVMLVQRSVKPYSGGGSLEQSFVAHDSATTYLYLGYVTSRKVFNFTLTCGPDRVDAVNLYNKIMQRWLRVKVPWRWAG